MFCDRVNELFELLGATSADIARHAGCSQSNVSRLRAGTRTPSAGSPTVAKLLDGAYRMAVSTNSLPSLCSMLDTLPASGEIAVKAALSAWLFDGQTDALPTPRKKRYAHKPAQFRSFGEKLNAVMNMLDLSNVRLGRAINLDPSHISRLRNGVRTPKSDMLLVNLICAELAARTEEQKKGAELARFTGVAPSVPEDAEDAENLLRNWLCDIDSPSDCDSLDRLLGSIETFNLANGISLPQLSAVATDEILGKTDCFYRATQGLREAVIRFLGDAERDRASELWLYSDQDMDWLVGDADFRVKWLALMAGCVKNRTKIRIIHNIDRGSDEMLSAIQSWMPLYMSGMIEPYACRKRGDMRFSHTLFLRPDKACVCAFNVRGTEAEGYYEYVTDPGRLEALAAQYGALVSNSEPLVKIHVSESGFYLRESSLPDEKGNLSVLLSSLSLGTMPPELLESILDRNGIQGAEREKISLYCDGRRRRLLAALESGSVREFIPTPTDEALFGSEVRINFGALLLQKELFYTPVEYARHIRAVIDLLNGNTSYHFYVLPQSPFDGIQIIHRASSVTVIRHNKPYAAFVFTHPYMLRAFDDYYGMLKKKYSSSRGEVRAALAKYL